MAPLRQSSRPRPLTAGEMRGLLDAQAGRGPAAGRNRALIRALADAGLGVGESLALTAADVDPPARRLTVRGARPRSVNIPTAAMDDITAWQAQREALRLGDVEPFFCTSEGQSLDSSYVRRMLGRLGRAAGIEVAVNARALRETFAAAQLASGSTTEELRAALGHSTIAGARRHVERMPTPDEPDVGHARPVAVTEALLARAFCGLAVMVAVRSPAGAVIDYRFEYLNPAAAGFLGASPESLVGRSVRARFPTAADDGTYDCWTALIADQEGGGEGRLWYGDGDRRQCLRVRRAAYGDRVVMSFEDRGPLRAAEEETERLRARMAALMAATRQGLLMVDPDGRISAANPSAERILGFSADRLIGRSAFDPRWEALRTDGSEIATGDLPIVVTMTTGRALADQQIGVRRSDGRMLWLSVSTSASGDADVPPFGVVVAFTDLEELREVRSAGRCARGAAALAADSADALVLRCAPDGLIRDAYGASVDLVGCETHEMLGHRCEERVHPEDAAAVRRAYREAMASTAAVRLDHRVIDLAGRTVPVERILRAVRDGDDVLEVQSVIRRAGDSTGTP